MSAYKEGIFIIVMMLFCFGIFCWGLVFVTKPDHVHDKLLHDKCREICQPYEIMLCRDQTAKYWTPEYIDAIVVCNGAESKKVDFIK